MLFLTFIEYSVQMEKQIGEDCELLLILDKLGQIVGHVLRILTAVIMVMVMMVVSDGGAVGHGHGGGLGLGDGVHVIVQSRQIGDARWGQIVTVKGTTGTDIIHGGHGGDNAADNGLRVHKGCYGAKSLTRHFHVL